VKFYGLRFTAEPPSTASFAATAAPQAAQLGAQPSLRSQPRGERRRPPRAPTRNFARGHFEHSGSALPCERESFSSY